MSKLPYYLLSEHGILDVLVEQGVLLRRREELGLHVRGPYMSTRVRHA